MLLSAGSLCHRFRPPVSVGDDSGPPGGVSPQLIALEGVSEKSGVCRNTLGICCQPDKAEAPDEKKTQLPGSYSILALGSIPPSVGWFYAEVSVEADGDTDERQQDADEAAERHNSVHDDEPEDQDSEIEGIPTAAASSGKRAVVPLCIGLANRTLLRHQLPGDARYSYGYTPHQRRVSCGGRMSESYGDEKIECRRPTEGGRQTVGIFINFFDNVVGFTAGKNYLGDAVRNVHIRRWTKQNLVSGVGTTSSLYLSVGLGRPQQGTALRLCSTDGALLSGFSFDSLSQFSSLHPSVSEAFEFDVLSFAQRIVSAKFPLRRTFVDDSGKQHADDEAQGLSAKSRTTRNRNKAIQAIMKEHLARRGFEKTLATLSLPPNPLGDTDAPADEEGAHESCDTGSWIRGSLARCIQAIRRELLSDRCTGAFPSRGAWSAIIAFVDESEGECVGATLSVSVPGIARAKDNLLCLQLVEQLVDTCAGSSAPLLQQQQQWAALLRSITEWTVWSEGGLPMHSETAAVVGRKSPRREESDAEECIDGRTRRFIGRTLTNVIIAQLTTHSNSTIDDPPIPLLIDKERLSEDVLFPLNRRICEYIEKLLVETIYPSMLLKSQGSSSVQLADESTGIGHRRLSPNRSQTHALIPLSSPLEVYHHARRCGGLLEEDYLLQCSVDTTLCLRSSLPTGQTVRREDSRNTGSTRRSFLAEEAEGATQLRTPSANDWLRRRLFGALFRESYVR